jgi:hypothetical protein
VKGNNVNKKGEGREILLLTKREKGKEGGDI